MQFQPSAALISLCGLPSSSEHLELNFRTSWSVKRLIWPYHECLVAYHGTSCHFGTLSVWGMCAGEENEAQLNIRLCQLQKRLR